jgi:myo-inositol-1(or 4)-monophosphatase
MEEVERVAAEAVDEAGRVLKEAWGKAKRVEFKGTVDLVTDTDRQVEELIAGRLRRAFPGHRLVAEEASGTERPAPPGEAEHVWYVDPLDGTTNFAHSFPQFAVSLALARGPDVLLGIVHDPVRDETFRARRGGGATLNGSSIRVSAVADLGHALLGTGFPYDRRVYLDYYLGFVRDFILSAQDVRRAGSAALDLCHVACGRLDGFWEWKLHPWDTAAGALIVREAGGRTSDFRGRPFDPHGAETLASNGFLHDALLGVLATRLGVAPPWERGRDTLQARRA